MLTKYDITQAVLSEEYADDLISSNLPIKCQYAIDTGMNRIGLDADDAESCEKEIRRVALVFSESSMNNIQSVSIISAFPIGIIMILMIWSFFKDAKMYREEKGLK